MSNQAQSLAVNTIKNSILNIASFVIGLGVNIFLVRYVVAQIGLDAYGISALLLVIIAPLSLANLGFGEATTKYVAEYMQKGDKQTAAAFVRTTFFMNLSVGIVGATFIFFFGGSIFMWAFSKQIAIEQTQLINYCMKMIALGWIINQCSATFMSIPVAVQQFKLVAIGNIVFVITTALFALLFISSGYGLLGYVSATVCGQFSALVYWLFTSKKILWGVSLMPFIDKEAWKKSFHFGGWQTVSQLGGIVAQQSEKYVLGIFLPTAAVGVYNVVLNNIQQKIYAIVHKLAEVLFPLFSSISNDEVERKANILIKSTWITTTLSVSLLVSVIPLANPIIHLIMKNKELANSGEDLLRILCIAGAFGSATTAGYFFLLGIGKTVKITYISIITGAVTVLVSLLAIPKFGLIAAGFGPMAGALIQSMVISKVMRTALKNMISLNIILTTIYVPIITGIVYALSVWYCIPVIQFSWFTFILSYGFMICSTAALIFLITRLLPHGKEYEELILKLYFHLTTKLKAQYAKN